MSVVLDLFSNDLVIVSREIGGEYGYSKMSQSDTQFPWISVFHVFILQPLQMTSVSLNLSNRWLLKSI